MKFVITGGVCASLLTLTTTVFAETESAKGPAAEAPATAEPSNAGIFIEPLLAFLGFYEGDVLVGVGDQVALGASFQHYDYELLGVGISGSGVGVGAQFFPLQNGRTFQGFYVYPAVKYLGMKFSTIYIDENGAEIDVAKVSYYSPQVTTGYQWDWQPFSLRLGGGLEYSFGRKLDSEFTKVDFSGLGYELDAAIGLTF